MYLYYTKLLMRMHAWDKKNNIRDKKKMPNQFCIRHYFV